MPDRFLRQALKRRLDKGIDFSALSRDGQTKPDWLILAPPGKTSNLRNKVGNKMGALYRWTDPIGQFLSFWRTSHVLREVSGFTVDLACGDNRIIREHGQGQGVDIDARGQEEVLVCPDFTNLPFEDASIDTVTIVASLNCFDEPTGVLGEVKRILKPDGKLVLTMSNATAMHYWHKVRDTWVNRAAFTDEEMLSMFKENGLVVERRRSFMFGLNKLFIVGHETS